MVKINYTGLSLSRQIHKFWGAVVPITVSNFLIELLRTDFFNTPKTGLELFRVCTEQGKNEMRRWKPKGDPKK